MGSKKSISEQYDMLTPLELVLERPAMYIGGMQPEVVRSWILNDDGTKMIQRDIEYTRGLLQIFVEILTNAIDQSKRCEDVTQIKVIIDREKGAFQVYNNGDGIRIEKHPKFDGFVPEMVFTEFATSENYNKKLEKNVGGTHGIGAKATVVFSKWFKIETADGSRKFTQVLENNLSKKGEPKIKDGIKSQFTKITFIPDYSRFGVTGITDGLYEAVRKVVYDTCVLTDNKVGVWFNGEKIGIKNLKDYTSLYVGNETGIAFEEVEPKKGFTWKYCIARGVCAEGARVSTFGHVSFINGVATRDGGTHVDYLMKQIVPQLVTIAGKVERGIKIRDADIRNQCFLVLIATVKNPEFSSQIKDKLTSSEKRFGLDFKVSSKFIKSASADAVGIIGAALAVAARLDNKKLSKTDGTLVRDVNVEKLEDANWAGHRTKSHLCTLIVTEGDSAKASVLSGINKFGHGNSKAEGRGRDVYGVYPLRGKVMNVRDKSNTAVAANKEFENLKKILGLKQGKDYADDIDGLRYGKLMILTDADVDGTHIAGLIINLINVYWPKLLENNKFLVRMATPILKATRKGKRSSEVKEFYGNSQYEEWKKGIEIKDWNIKYYKGLGTSDKKEFEKYCENPKLVKYEWDRNSLQNIELAFDKKLADARKGWVGTYNPEDTIDYDNDVMTFSNFINKDLKQYSVASNVRSIPNVIDGLKPSSRKILCAAFQGGYLIRPREKAPKVSQVAGRVSETMEYHHGEASLTGTIVGMAQNYVGSNNINLLEPIGQFGARTDGGKKSAAQPRYINTVLNGITRLLFPKEDDVLLDYKVEEGIKIEPEYFVPIIPMILINGTEGIGTGYSTTFPNYKPSEVIQNLMRLIDGDTMIDIKPWYRGFRGTIMGTDKSGYTSYGKIQHDEKKNNVIRITELPIKRWTDDYMEFLKKLKKEGTIVKRITNFNSDTTIDIIIEFTKPTRMLFSNDNKIVDKLKLKESNIKVSNMCAYNAKHEITRYTVHQIIQEFYEVRLALYVKRREYQLSEMKRIKKKLIERARFVKLVCEGEIELRNVKREVLENKLREHKFVEDPETGFDALLGMKLWSITKERLAALLEEVRKIKEDYKELKDKTAEDLWKEDLEKLIDSKEYKEIYN